MKTPECNKLLKVKNESQAIGSFLDWLKGERELVLCKYDGEDDELNPTYLPDYTTIEHLLAEYFKINLNKVEQERGEILVSLRRKNK